jgi:hypothetical protein
MTEEIGHDEVFYISIRFIDENDKTQIVKKRGDINDIPLLIKNIKYKSLISVYALNYLGKTIERRKAVKEEA